MLTKMLRRTVSSLRVGRRPFSKEVAIQSAAETPHSVETNRMVGPSGISDIKKKVDADLAAENKDYFDMLNNLDAR